jgi:hypothetical protein
LEGAGRVRVENSGSVRATTPLGEVLIHPPITYDACDGERREVGGRFVRRAGGVVEFRPN